MRLESAIGASGGAATGYQGLFSSLGSTLRARCVKKRGTSRFQFSLFEWEEGVCKHMAL